jgi:hypothetical protein
LNRIYKLTDRFYYLFLSRLTKWFRKKFHMQGAQALRHEVSHCVLRSAEERSETPYMGFLQSGQAGYPRPPHDVSTPHATALAMAAVYSRHVTYWRYVVIPYTALYTCAWKLAVNAVIKPYIA